MAKMSTVRRRIKAVPSSSGGSEVSEEQPRVDGLEENVSMQSGTYWLTRIVFIRALGFIYLVAFLVALNQNKELIGSNGLLPIPMFYSRVRKLLGVPRNGTVTLSAFAQAPSLFWFISSQNIDFSLDLVACTGIALSALLLLTGSGNVLIFIVLRILYHSLVYPGQVWYAFGWEVQLLETGFLAIFVVPLFSLRRFPRGSPTSWAVVWGSRWLLFRIMLGAGLIKIKGDQCWRDLTCMNYHYETQPVPNPLSYFLHQTPELLHVGETVGNHIVELVVPFLVFLPRPFRLICGVTQILFQVILICSGNLSFLNWLTILPAIFCFDDLSLKWLFSKASKETVIKLQQSKDLNKPIGYYVRQTVNVLLALLIAWLSIPAVQNLLSTDQLMNSAFEPFNIVNTYGAFGSITRQRTEVVLEGTHSETAGPEAEWLEIEFKCKPGRTDRRPCVISPYHYRLDWLMWFAAFQDYTRNPWLVHVAIKIMSGDPSINNLIDHNPFLDTPPKFMRAQHYRYSYTKLGSPEAREGHWWSRKLIAKYLPEVDERQLKSIARQQDWTWYKPAKS